MTDYAAFFNPFRRKGEEVDPEEAMLRDARMLMDFAATGYFPVFVAWLDREASRPLKIGDPNELIQSAVRANTLREIREHLVKRVEAARAAMAEGTE